MYNFGETILPVCPTCSEYGLHPASTTALDAPVAAPNTFANSSIILNLSGSCNPLPPETIMSASKTSIFSISGFFISINFIPLFSY